MSRRPRGLVFLSLFAVAALGVSACSGGAPAPSAQSRAPSVAPATSAAASVAPSAAATSPAASESAAASGSPAPSDTGSSAATESAAPTDAASPTVTPRPTVPAGATVPTQRYPEEGEVTCAADGNPGSYNDTEYSGQIQSIEATDERTVVFTLCGSDVAFLSKVAFSPFAINDSAWLEAHIPDGSIVSQPNGTGPYELQEWRQGQEVIYSRFEDYWGEPAKTSSAVLRWTSESAARLQELQSGTVQGIDNVGATDFDLVRNDPNLQLMERPGLNVFYVGFNNNPTIPGYDNSQNPFANEQVRQAVAMGIDRQRIVDTFLPPGSEVASHFTPCALQFGCEGEEWYGFDATAAKQMLAEAGYPEGFDTTITFRDVVRGYLPTPSVVAQDLQSQLLTNLNIRAEIVVQESGTFIENANGGLLDGIHLLGWGADYPDVTNFLDFHFGGGATPQFGDKFDDITEPLTRGGSSTDEAERTAAYREANNAIREHVPMVPISHAGSATAYVAGLTGGQASPLTNESFAVMDPPGDADQLVFMQNAEPISLFCADETDGESLRACEQVTEALYAYEINGTATQPALAESCEPNEELSVWTCTLREGVTFHDGSTLDAGDVVASYAIQWDAAHPYHLGNTSQFAYFSALWGGFLNPPPAEE